MFYGCADVCSEHKLCPVKCFVLQGSLELFVVFQGIWHLSCLRFHRERGYSITVPWSVLGAFVGIGKLSLRWKVYYRDRKSVV